MFNRNITTTALLIAASISARAIAAEDRTYVGGAGTGNWSLNANWSPVGIPEAGDNAFLTPNDGAVRTVVYDAVGPLNFDYGSVMVTTTPIAGNRCASRPAYRAFRGGGDGSEFDEVPVRVLNVRVGHAGGVLAPLDKVPAGRDDFGDRSIEVHVWLEAEAEVVDAPSPDTIHPGRVCVDRDRVARPRCPQEHHRRPVAELLFEPESGLVEPQ